MLSVLSTLQTYIPQNTYRLLLGIYRDKKMYEKYPFCRSKSKVRFLTILTKIVQLFHFCFFLILQTKAEFSEWNLFWKNKVVYYFICHFHLPVSYVALQIKMGGSQPPPPLNSLFKIGGSVLILTYMCRLNSPSPYFYKWSYSIISNVCMSKFNFQLGVGRNVISCFWR